MICSHGIRSREPGAPFSLPVCDKMPVMKNPHPQVLTRKCNLCKQIRRKRFPSFNQTQDMVFAFPKQ